MNDQVVRLQRSSFLFLSGNVSPSFSRPVSPTSVGLFSFPLAKSFFIKVLFLLLLLLVQEGFAQQTHKVKFGETLYSIAKKYNVPFEQFMKWNHLNFSNQLQTGQILIVSPVGFADSIFQAKKAGAFSEYLAMNLLYDNYDSLRQKAILLPNTPRKETMMQQLEAGAAREVSARFLLAAEFKPGDSLKALLVTATFPDATMSGCRTCAPMITVAAFTKRNDEWTMDTVTANAGRRGQWGQAPAHCFLQPFGRNNYGLMFVDLYAGNGVEREVINLLAPVKGKYKFVGDIETGSSDKGSYLPKYSYRSKIEFFQGTNEHFKNIKLTRLIDSTLVSGNRPEELIKAEQVLIYVFDEKKEQYVLRGSPTYRIIERKKLVIERRND